MSNNFSANCHNQQFKLDGSGRNGPASEIQVLRVKFYDSSSSANDLLSAVERLFDFGGPSSGVLSVWFQLGSLYSAVLVWQSKLYVSAITGSLSNQVHPFRIYGTSAMVRVRGVCSTVGIQLFKRCSTVGIQLLKRYQLQFPTSWVLAVDCSSMA